MLGPLVTMFVTGRFILGFANIFCLVASSSLIGGKILSFELCPLVVELCTELSHPKERVVIGCLFNSSWDLGKSKS